MDQKPLIDPIKYSKCYVRQWATNLAEIFPKYRFLKSYRKLEAWNSQTSYQCIEDVLKSGNLQYNALGCWVDLTKRLTFQ